MGGSQIHIYQSMTTSTSFYRLSRESSYAILRSTLCRAATQSSPCFLCRCFMCFIFVCCFVRSAGGRQKTGRMAMRHYTDLPTPLYLGLKLTKRRQRNSGDCTTRMITNLLHFLNLGPHKTTQRRSTCCSREEVVYRNYLTTRFHESLVAQAKLDPQPQDRCANAPVALCFAGYRKLSLLYPFCPPPAKKEGQSRQRGSAGEGASHFVQVSLGHRATRRPPDYSSNPCPPNDMCYMTFLGGVLGH